LAFNTGLLECPDNLYIDPEIVNRAKVFKTRTNKYT